jgi:hypothetical protein
MFDGRVVAIGAQPILEALAPPAGRKLIIYGHPGKTYRIDNSSSMQTGTWFSEQFLLNDLFLETAVPFPDTRFFRGREVAP